MNSGVTWRIPPSPCKASMQIPQTPVENFERKRYASLSQEANKAMNINAYLGLMGARH